MSDFDQQDGGESLDDLLGDISTKKSKADEETILEIKSREYKAKLKAKAAEVKAKSKDYTDKARKDAVEIIDHTGEARGKAGDVVGKAAATVGVFKAKTGLSLLPIVIGLCIGGWAIYKSVRVDPPTYGQLNQEAMRAQNINTDWPVNETRTSNEYQYKSGDLPELDMSKVEKEVGNIRFTSCVRSSGESWKCTVNYDNSDGPQKQVMTFRAIKDVAPMCIDCTRAWMVASNAQPIGRVGKDVVYAIKKGGAQ